MFTLIKKFIQLESAGGLLLLMMTILALGISNSPLSANYRDFLATSLTVSLGDMILSKPLIFWINDGLMAIFFLLVGLEIKRELLEGELNTRAKAILPAIAAIGGMLVPALIYTALNYNDHFALRGWAIPTATDIAFSLGLLALLGSRIPIAAKILLTAIAIIDDLGAIIIIALFYTDDLSWLALGMAGGCTLGLLLLNRCGVVRFAPYGLLGLVMWVFVLRSGIHATLVGVVLAAFYPIRDRKDPKTSPLKNVESAIHPWVAFGILPLFAFANAGVELSGVNLESLTNAIPLGIILGLFVGKQVGIFTASWAAIRLGLAKMPNHLNWPLFYGISILCGIGFTMSLFIGTLAFTEASMEHNVLLRLGVLMGSLCSGVVGCGVLFWVSRGLETRN